MHAQPASVRGRDVPGRLDRRDRVAPVILLALVDRSAGRCDPVRRRDRRRSGSCSSARGAPSRAPPRSRARTTTSTGCSSSRTRPSAAGRCSTRSGRRGLGRGRSEILVVTPPLAAPLRRALVVRHRRGDRRRRAAPGGVGGDDARGRTQPRGQLADHHDPNQAIEDALGTFAADEVIISRTRRSARAGSSRASSRRPGASCRSLLRTWSWTSRPRPRSLEIQAG